MSESSNKDEEGAYYMEVFSNDLIFRKLERMIGLKELKALREVSRDLNRVVLEHRDFYARSVMVLDKHSLKDPFFLTSSMTPKSLAILPFELAGTNKGKSMRIDEDKLNKRISGIMENCEWLSIWDRESRVGKKRLLPEHDPIHGWDDDYDDLSLPDLYPKVLDVVRLGKGVKTLVLHGQAAMLLNQSIKEDGQLLSGLSSIEFRGNGRVYIPELFTGLTGIERLRTSAQLCSSDFFDGSEEEAIRFATFLDNNKGTLMDLGYTVNVSKSRGYWINEKEFGNRVFPNLKTLNLCVYDSEGLMDILLAQKNSLEEVRMNFLARESDEREVKAILKTLCQDLPKLRVLELESSHLKIISRNYARSFKMLQLDELSVKNSNWSAMEDVPPFTYTDVFSGIPVCLKRLYLNGQLSMQARLGLDSRELINFSALTELELTSLESLTNEFVQQICKHLLLLRSLEINDNKKITDAAFLGANNPPFLNNQSIKTIKNLKCLESLALIRLGITKKTILEGITFRNLKVLQLGEMKLHERSLYQLLSENPMLERIQAKSCASFVVKTLNKFLQEGFNFPQFKHYNGSIIE